MFEDPGLNALWRMQVDADRNEQRAFEKRRAREWCGIAGSGTATDCAKWAGAQAGSQSSAPSFDLGALGRRPESDHPVDSRLDTSLRLMVLDTLQKQLVIIGHIMA